MTFYARLPKEIVYPDMRASPLPLLRSGRGDSKRVSAADVATPSELEEAERGDP